ncbi:MAG: response regulator [Candidatus Saccharimonadales bacterium]
MTHRILVVEDEPSLLEVYGIILKAAGFEVTLSANGKDALKRIKQSEFDLILLDLLMPVLDGWGFLKKANVKLNYPATKVIIFSNLSNNEQVNQALALGGDLHLIKAHTAPDQLISTIKSQLKSRS